MNALIRASTVSSLRSPGPVGRVESPSRDPLGPRFDCSQQSHPDLPDPGGAIEDPVQDAGPVRDVLREVGVEQGVHGAGASELADERQVEVRCDP